MGLGGKLFSSGFAQGATAPILEQQKNDLALLQDRLRAIAQEKREIAVQTLAGQQAAERTIFQQQQMMLREQLSQIGQTQRAQMTRRGSIEDDAAEAGVAFIDFKDNETLLNQISTINGNIRAAETSREAMDALAERNRWALELTERTGIQVPPEAFDSPELMREITRHAAAEARRREALQNSPDLDQGFLNMIAGMGGPGAAVIDQMVNSWEREGTRVDPATYAKAMAAKWAALGPDSQMEGFAKASGIIQMRIDNITSAIFMGDLPSAMDLQIMEGGLEMYEKVRQQVDEMLADPVFSASLYDMTGFTTNQVMGSAPLQYEDLLRFQASTRQLQIDADQRANSAQAMTSLAYPAQDQQQTLQVAASSLFEQMVPEALATGDVSAIERLALMYEEQALIARDGQQPVGQEHLVESDYVGVAEWIREQLRFLEQKIQFDLYQNSVGGQATVPQQFGGVGQPGGAPAPGPPRPSIQDTANQFGQYLNRGGR